MKWRTPTKINGKNPPEYKQWKNMVHRCKEKSWKRNPRYTNSTMTRDWENYDTYLLWARAQKGFLCQEESGRFFSLDKDLLITGNKHYSPDTCCFVPNEVNSFFTNTHKEVERALPTGVYFDTKTNKYMASMSYKKTIHLGSFNSAIEAEKAYLIAKQYYGNVLVTKYMGILDPRVLIRLLNSNSMNQGTNHEELLLL